jgi:hypothetical protein
MIAAVVNPIVAMIEISIHASMKLIVRKGKKERSGVASCCCIVVQANPRLPVDHGFNDSVYARSWDQPLMAGVCAAV